MKTNPALIHLGLACVAFGAFAPAGAGAAEQPASAAKGSGRGGSSPSIVSPEVHADGRATFRLRAPEARRVELGGILANPRRNLPKEFQKGVDGVWTLTIGPLAPDTYYYQFVVDGMNVPDPNNPVVKAGTRALQNTLEIAGATPTFYALRADVPHGTVTTVYYASPAHGGMRQLSVYLPPDYGKEPMRKFPVLYLLHGAGDHERSWLTEGRANLIVDNLLAGRRAQPMIVVMPFIGTPSRGGGRGAGAAGPAENPFARDLLETIMPLVEERFAVKTGKAQTAMVGLSMGGGQTLRVGLANPDKFAWIGAFSSAIFAREGTPPKPEDFMKSVATANADYKLIWIGCGRQDGLFAANDALARGLKECGIKHVWHPTEGGHTWPLWREYLRDVLPLLFRE